MTMTDTVGDYVDALKGGSLDADLLALYGKAEFADQKQRYARLLETMEARFAPDTAAVIISPGRTELGGNHTDHNHGQVLAAAVHLDCVAVAAPVPGMQVVIHSSGFPELIRADLSDLAPRPEERGRSESLVRGVAAGLAEKGCRIGGFTACVNSTVLPGSGLSSSAAFGILLGGIFNHLFNRCGTTAFDLAGIAKLAENEFFGKPCGFMDQLTCALGGVLHIDFKSHLDPDVERIDFEFTQAGYQLAVVDTGGNHAELTPEYAAITKEMGAAALLLGKEVLRELSIGEVIRAIPRLRQKAGDRAILRTIHFVEENQRVGAMVSALRRNQVEAYLKLVSASGASSWRLLQNCFRTSTPQLQGIPLAQTLTERFLDGNGACRVHGGGFEGTIQAYVPKARFDDYRKFMERVFGPGSVMALRIRRPGVSRLRPGGLDRTFD
jgi:galactokinase